MEDKNKVIDTYIKVVLKHAGGYANDPSDPGAETYCGISRVHHPHWKGWPIVDGQEHPIAINSFFKELDDHVYEFYRDNYIYSAMGVPGVARINVNLGMHMFDFGVDAGISRSAKMLQRILKVDQDGVVGKNTLAALKKQSADSIVVEFVDARSEYYRLLGRRHEWARKFLKGWLRRVNECTPALALELWG